MEANIISKQKLNIFTCTFYFSTFGTVYVAFVVVFLEPEVEKKSFVWRSREIRRNEEWLTTVDSLGTFAVFSVASTLTIFGLRRCNSNELQTINQS